MLARLASDHIGWLTTVRADGSPHAVPVWFLWHDGRLLVMSEPRTAKVTNVRRGSPALLHLHTRDDGNGVVVLSGPAVISDRTAPQWLPEISEAYTAKYAEAMVAYGMGLVAIAEKFTVVIELEPTDLHGVVRPHGAGLPELPVAAEVDAAPVDPVAHEHASGAGGEVGLPARPRVDDRGTAGGERPVEGRHERAARHAGAHVHVGVAEVVGRQHGRVGHLDVHLDPLVAGVGGPTPGVEDGRDRRHGRLVGDEHLPAVHLEPAVERTSGPDADGVARADAAGPRRAGAAVAVGHDVDLDPPADRVVVADRVPAQGRPVGLRDRRDGGTDVDRLGVRHDERAPGRGHEQADVLVGAERHEGAQARRPRR